jgi:hypothetical protein
MSQETSTPRAKENEGTRIMWCMVLEAKQRPWSITLVRGVSSDGAMARGIVRSSCRGRESEDEVRVASTSIYSTRVTYASIFVAFATTSSASVDHKFAFYETRSPLYIRTNHNLITWLCSRWGDTRIYKNSNTPEKSRSSPCCITDEI